MTIRIAMLISVLLVSLSNAQKAASAPQTATPKPSQAQVDKTVSGRGAGEAGAQASAQTNQGYRIDEPGTITFTVGVTIKGKVEKPQVVIFLPKERPTYRPVTYTYSFEKDIMKPVPFDNSMGP